MSKGDALECPLFSGSLDVKELTVATSFHLNKDVETIDPRINKKTDSKKTLYKKCSVRMGSNSNSGSKKSLGNKSGKKTSFMNQRKNSNDSGDSSTRNKDDDKSSQKSGSSKEESKSAGLDKGSKNNSTKRISGFAGKN